jgi:hypothetical protein
VVCCDGLPVYSKTNIKVDYILHNYIHYLSSYNPIMSNMNTKLMHLHILLVSNYFYSEWLK